MISGISKKAIFFSFLFFNLFQPSKSAEFQKIHKNLNSPTFQSELSNNNLEHLLADSSNNPKEIVIKSDKQSEIKDVIYAEGNVLVTYQGKIFKADAFKGSSPE